jgi:hypothetical protein
VLKYEKWLQERRKRQDVKGENQNIGEEGEKIWLKEGVLQVMIIRWLEQMMHKTEGSRFRRR